ncbi:hypothetical protein CVT25_000799 [Psilocybe cyanescens]|uniref:Uncharacterized protein n=1 Tax=Psilocybe cyanescens TaxID=93625 RepID=A0A409XGZ3_PSICY|nr:hypothetical protein CVT25_000799 [Psilocybe cyanescens]
MPASESLLCAFSVTKAAGKESLSCLGNWLAGIHFWHSLNGAPWHGDNALRIAKAGVRKLVPNSAHRDKCPPVTLAHMHALKVGLDPVSPLDAAVWALACVAFWSCCQLGELTVPSLHSFDPAKHVACSAPTVLRSSPGGINSAHFHIPWSKTTHYAGADIIIMSNGDPSDPLAALLNHLAVNAGLPDGAPYFAYRTAEGWSPLTKSAFLARCERIWFIKGLPKMAGHAFCIGGATELLLRGTHPDVVAVQGCWRSKAFLKYWHQIEGILSLFITGSFNADRAAQVSETMEAYHRLHNSSPSS